MKYRSVWREIKSLKAHLKTHNTVYSHRMRLAINVLDKSEKSIAQIQNGFIENTPDVIPPDWFRNYGRETC